MSQRLTGVYVLNSSDRELVEQHRHENLLSTDSFRATPDAIRWSESDERGLVLGVFNSARKLVASMRLERIGDPQELRSKLDFDGLESRVTLPCALLGKAATANAARGEGLNSYLRFLAYGIFQRAGLETVVGTLVPGAPRSRLLEQLGYEFIDNPEGWRRFGYSSYGPTQVAVLDLKRHGSRVVEVLAPMASALGFRYPLRFDVAQAAAHLRHPATAATAARAL